MQVKRKMRTTIFLSTPPLHGLVITKITETNVMLNCIETPRFVLHCIQCTLIQCMQWIIPDCTLVSVLTISYFLPFWSHMLPPSSPGGEKGSSLPPSSFDTFHHLNSHFSQTSLLSLSFLLKSHHFYIEKIVQNLMIYAFVTQLLIFLFLFIFFSKNEKKIFFWLFIR